MTERYVSPKPTYGHWRGRGTHRGIWWAQVPLMVAARIDQLAPGDLLRLNVMIADRVFACFELARTGRLELLARTAGDADFEPATPDTLLRTIEALPGVPTFSEPRQGFAVQLRTQAAAPLPLRRTADEHTWHLDREQIGELLHHEHPMAVMQSRHLHHLAQVLPGWSWDDAIGTLSTADVRLCLPEAPGVTLSHVPVCRPTVYAMHVTSPNDWLVEWGDGWVSEAPVRSRARA